MEHIKQDLISECELASELNRTERTVKRWRNERIGPPFIQIGRETLYRRDAVRDWLLSKETAQARAKGGAS